MEIGTKIKELRVEYRLKQKELAAKIHIAANTLSQFETGKANPRLRRADYACRFFRSFCGLSAGARGRGGKRENTAR